MFGQLLDYLKVTQRGLKHIYILNHIISYDCAFWRGLWTVRSIDDDHHRLYVEKMWNYRS